jgi:hypothetical protein
VEALKLVPAMRAVMVGVCICLVVLVFRPEAATTSFALVALKRCPRVPSESVLGPAGSVAQCQSVPEHHPLVRQDRHSSHPVLQPMAVPAQSRLVSEQVTAVLVGPWHVWQAQPQTATLVESISAVVLVLSAEAPVFAVVQD